MNKNNKLSSRTKNICHISIEQVFVAVGGYERSIANVFAGIDKIATVYQEREAFSREELKLIYEKADSFIMGLFVIEIHTGLRDNGIRLSRKWCIIDNYQLIINN